MTDGPQSVVVHGHFYQPPREDPWLEEVAAEPNAAPYHDWNQRIERECYRAVVAARVPGAGGRIRTIVNTLASISFNFGPTLLEWLERKAPTTYQAIREADARSRSRLGGFGNAIAQPYHHTILPLASHREKVTEVRWGIADFRRRYGRDPLGMWLPETAVDPETLEVLAQEGLAFTILAPHQVDAPPAGGMPGLWKSAGGRTLALFVYDGPLSHDVAFGPLLKDADIWARRMQRPGARLVSIATDGETYGHHHRFSEMALAAVLARLGDRPGIRVENFASFLARHPPVTELRLRAPSSWSCAHGVERWRSDCGCKMDPSLATQQRWRAPLRQAMERLAEELHLVYEREAPELLGSPVAALDGLGEIFSAGPGALRDYVRRLAPAPLSASQETRAAELLEMERNAHRLFTSCAWFFDDLAGLEPLQILRYAARAMELAGPGAPTLESAFLSILQKGTTNEEPPRDGRRLFLEEVAPPVPAPLRVAGGFAALHFVGSPAGDLLPGYGAEIDPESAPALVQMAAAGRSSGTESLAVRVFHRRTGRSWQVRTRCWKTAPGELAVEVGWRDDPARGLILALDDLPEGYATRTLAAWRQGILSRWLLPGEGGEAALGDEIEELASLALVDAIDALAEQEGDWALSRVTELAELHILLRQAIPFDAQSRFQRLLDSSPPSRAARLAELGPTLGFVLPT